MVDTQAAYLLLRYSLSVRFHFLTGMVGPALAHGADGASPLATHDTRLIRSLTFLLVDPTVSYQLREARVAAGLGCAAILQAELCARDGGLSLAGARMMWASTHLARAMAVLPYLLEHCAVYQLTDTALQPDAALPYFDGLRVALRALHDQSLTACVAYPDLASLLSGPPRSQHDLAEGVFASRLTAKCGRLSRMTGIARGCYQQVGSTQVHGWLSSR